MAGYPERVPALSRKFCRAQRRIILRHLLDRRCCAGSEDGAVQLGETLDDAAEETGTTHETALWLIFI